jgi:hypothetical protein
MQTKAVLGCGIMNAVRGAWTDERLDDLSARVDRGFDRVSGDVRDLRAEMDVRFDRVNGELGDLRTEMNTHFDAMQRTMALGFASVVASVVGAVIATGGAILATQL